MKYQQGRSQQRRSFSKIRDENCAKIPRLGVAPIARPRHLATSLAASLASTLMLGAIATAEPIPFGRPLPGRSSAAESTPSAPASQPSTRATDPSPSARSRVRSNAAVAAGTQLETVPTATPNGGWLETSGTAASTSAIPVAVPNLAPSANGYVVVVPGETLAILDQVRQWDPEASFSTEGGRTVVQSAPVATLAAAQAHQAQWRSHGLAATVAPAPRAAIAAPVASVGWAARPAIARSGIAVASATTSGAMRSPATNSAGMVDPSFLFATPETAPPQYPPARAQVPVTANLEPIPANAGSPPIGNTDASRASLPAPPPIPPEFLAQTPPVIAPTRRPSRAATQPVLPVAAAADPYFILIEGSDRELAQVGDRLLSFGLPRASLSRQREPFGPHLRLGPFNSVDSAQQWSNYLQRINVAAQVYHNGWIVDATQAMR